MNKKNLYKYTPISLFSNLALQILINNTKEQSLKCAVCPLKIYKEHKKYVAQNAKKVQSPPYLHNNNW